MSSRLYFYVRGPTFVGKYMQGGILKFCVNHGIFVIGPLFDRSAFAVKYNPMNLAVHSFLLLISFRQVCLVWRHL